MNILVLTPLIPYPPHDGDKLRLYHFLLYLKKRGHTIDLFCLTRVQDDLRYAEDLRPLCRTLYTEHINNWDLFFNLIGGLLIGQSLNVSSHFSPKMREVLKAYWQTTEGQKIDVVLAHRLRMAPAAFEGNPGKPVVLELTDSLTGYTQQLKDHSMVRGSRRLVAWWDYWFLKKEEVEWMEKAFQSIVISEPDSQVLREQGAPADKVIVIPNGVEPVRTFKFKRPNEYPAKRPVVCFVGNMGYPPNEDGAIWFLKKVWPRIKSEVPNAVFAAVGGQPRKILRKYNNRDDVLVTGWVPKVEPYVKYAAVSVAPLRVASGMQNKVALAMALGTLVVAPMLAFEWIPPKGRETVITAEDEEKFANLVVEAILKPRRIKNLVLRGQRFILRNYKWNESGKKLEAILKKAAQSTKV